MSAYAQGERGAGQTRVQQSAHNQASRYCVCMCSCVDVAWFGWIIVCVFGLWVCGVYRFVFSYYECFLIQSNTMRLSNSVTIRLREDLRNQLAAVSVPSL